MLGNSDIKVPTTSSSPTVYNTGVFVSTEVPEFTVAGPYPGNFKFGQNAIDDPQIEFIIEVKHKDGRLTMEFESANQWIRYIQPARDRHEQNAEFYKDQDGSIFLRTTRLIKVEEQLFVWYSEPLARMMGVPFLSLQHIIDNQQYRCDRCLRSFRYPNPLKTHMMQRCQYRDSQMTSCSGFGSPLRPTYQSSPTYVPLSLDYSCLFGNLPRMPKIYSKENRQIPDNWMNHTSPLSNLAMHPSPSKRHDVSSSEFAISVFNCINQKQFPYQYIPHNNFIPKAQCQNVPEKAKEELTLSNRPVIPLPSEVKGEPLDILPKSLLTKCKSGHICVFCGKLYSRKYGLKIHLRTHTGYKPLKCKICLRPFGDPSNLNKHVRLHAEGETPYRCEFCNKVLVRRRDLERHIRSRHPTETGSLSEAEIDETKESDNEEDIVVT